MSTRTDELGGAVGRLVVRDDCPCGACSDRYAVAARAAAVSLAPYLLAVALASTVLAGLPLLTLAGGGAWTLVVTVAVITSLRRARRVKR